MKNFPTSLILFLFLFSNSIIRAQTPQSFRYQAIVRNASGNVLQTQNVSLKISLLQSSSTGTVVYSEEHTATTNSFGLVNLEIGSGTNQSGTIASIDWAQGPYYLKIELDATGGSTYAEMGTTQLLSVPYALFAASGTPGPQGPQGETGTAGQDGQDGQPGADGIGITNSYVLNDSLYLVLSNAQVLNAGHVRGVQGVQGLQGIQGEQGLPGTNGIDGIDGVSVLNTYVNNDSLFITLSNNTTINAGHVRGLQGLPGTNATIHAGTGISISNDTLYNINPGSAINLTGSGATSVSGTYPDITISSTDNNTEYAAGTGLTLAGTTFNSTWTTSNTNIFNNNTGFVGIGTSNPLSSLHINGSLRVNDDSESEGFVLTSDASGNASWQPSSMTSSSGIANYIPRFISSTALDNSLLYQNGTKIGLGTTTPTSRLQVQADPLAHDTVPLFEIKDKNDKTVMVVYNDSIHFFIKDPGGSKAENKGAFAVSGKNSTKNITNNYFHLNTENLFSGSDAGKKLSSGMNYSGKHNTFIGYEAGYNDTSGYKNYFIGYKAGHSTTSGYSNIFIGDNSGYSNNVGYGNIFFGDSSGFSNTIGRQNVFIGYKAGFSNVGLSFASSWGAYNVFIGYMAGYSNVVGWGNAANGYKALYSNTANFNVANGCEALYSNTSGYNNVANGYYALNKNTTGFDNVANGSGSLSNNTIGNYNVANGKYALSFNTTGSSNVATGHAALMQNTIGGNNLAIGNYAFFAGADYSNSSAIGANTVMTQSNKVRIGDVNVTVIEGQVAYTFPSDGRFKKNITEEVKGLDFITLLRPIVYNFDTKAFDEFLMKDMPDSIKFTKLSKNDYSESYSIRQSGFIAQEVVEAAKKSGYDFNGIHKPVSDKDNYSVAYSLFTIPLVRAVQELNDINIDLQKKLELQEIKNEDLQRRIEDIEKLIMTK
ncbi:MAG: hypothetical protein A2275_15345 [Bacteroidetes bacterium RIFOXYA12_FULL_35_11]|nr:MAG: hypothetical protein A2X01_17865 [Bacteroidetes bacterium GWF2_35_48]OFY74098.1 MAG: hypothetical protein A2275_15345 [Bacteroidetes bacterium RIFOXYA12_FULL_35_11]OFY97196.1 MAG: hypothetical protein A2491_14700 [Bacteroidetes bacterium RIFOXYC12_FULL_35_7]